MTFEELLETYGGDIVAIKAKFAQNKPSFSVPLDTLLDEWNPYKHKVFDTNVRKKKKTKVADGYDANGQPKYKTKYTDVCRVAIPIQKVLVERSVGFLLSTPVMYSYKGKVSDKATELHEKVLRCFDDSKIDFFDKKLARSIFRGREAAELWYHVPNDKGKPSGDIRVTLLSAVNGDDLFPLFDSYGKMTAFMRVYTTIGWDSLKVTHIDVYTSTLLYNYTLTNGKATLEKVGPHGFDRIPIVYYRQEQSEWADVQPAIDRMETLVSNWGDTDDYFGSPSYFVKGALLGYAEKGEQGKIYQAQGESDMRVLSWDNSPESIRGELSTLRDIIFSFTQTPDVSFEAMKTLGNNTSGASIRLMFTDPHMKAQVKMEMFGEAFTRRYNIVKSVISTLNNISENVSDELYVRPQFTPYLPKNDAEILQMLTQCTTDSIISQETAVSKNPLVDNPQDELERLQSETTAKTTRNLFEPTE